MSALPHSVSSCEATESPSPICASLFTDWSGASVVGHDRIDEFLVVSGVVQAGALQRGDSRHGFIPEQRRVLADLDFTRTLEVWDATIERLDELAECGKDLGRLGS
jgi:hypothetical protein